MLNDEKRRELDQAMAAICEFLPPVWRQLYVKLVEEQFTRQQAFELVKTYVMATCGLSTNK